MKILFTGRGTSGSFQMRAVQLGNALGATVKPGAPQGDHDLAVVVKRVPDALLPHLTRWVWDVVDAYRQPAAYAWSREQAIQWFHVEHKRMKPDAVIWPTRQMQEDCDPRKVIPGIVLPHHCRQMTPAPVPGLVGYEGGIQYLGKWRPAIEAECARRGWQFVVNPKHYEQLSTVIAVRDGGGYVCSAWKSGVKHANAVAIGARFVGQPEAGAREMACGGEAWVESAGELSLAFDLATPLSGESYTVERAADDLKEFLYSL